MLEKLQECVGIGEKLGADFVEARFDDLSLRTLERTDDIWKEIQVKSRRGFAITCYVDGVSGFSFTASPDASALQATTERAYKMAKASSAAAELRLPFEKSSAVKSSASDTYSVKVHPRELDLTAKTDLVNRAVETAKEHGENVRNIRGRYGELYGQKALANSDGSEIDWNFLTIDLRCRITSKTDAGDMVIGAAGKGGTYGHEVFKIAEFTPEQLGKDAAARAKEQLEAKACPAGKFKSLIEETLVGVLAHESFGHLSEADFIVTSGSPLTGKMNETLGTEHATIIDGGVVDIEKTGGLWLPYDDQGTKTGTTTILDKGVLTHYLHDRGTANKLGQKPTGNSRAVTFLYPPIPRMTNTYFMPGDLNGEDEALELLDTGIYAIQTMGGQVQGDGSFLFKAIRGYYVEKGEIKYPIREVSLSGNILELLGKVEGATKNLKIRSGYFGGCGKGGQFPLPTGTGGPMLVVDGVTFGGQA
ncbi:MAG: TldD/PmbA family protein [Candidatus Thorarchaeota archaeon]